MKKNEKGCFRQTKDNLAKKQTKMKTIPAAALFMFSALAAFTRDTNLVAQRVPLPSLVDIKY